MKPAKRPEYARHLQLYAWAARHCFNKNVIEYGCGEGFGLQIISAFAQSVIGYDISHTFLQRASKKQYYCPSIIIGANLDTMEFPQAGENSVAVAFEILEHIDNPKRVVAELAGSGTPLIFSVPHKYPHPMHKTVYSSWDDVIELIRPYLKGRIEVFRYHDGNVEYIPYSADRHMMSEKMVFGDRYVVMCEPYGKEKSLF